MSVSAEYADYVMEMIEPIGRISQQRFFGGLRICRDATQFAMIMGNSLYFAVDDETRDKYVAAGMQPFSFATKKGRKEIRRYYELPEEVLGDPDLLKQWAHESIEAAMRRPRKASASKKVRR